MKKPADIDSALTKFYNYDHVLESQVQAKLTFRQQSDTASPEDDVALAFLAAGAGLVDVVRDMVVKRGVDVESARDQHGLSLLMTAVGHNAEQVVAFLLEHALTVGDGDGNKEAVFLFFLFFGFVRPFGSSISAAVATSSLSLMPFRLSRSFLLINHRI